MSIQSLTKELDKLRDEVSKVIIGRKKSINALLRTIICKSKVLVEGPPGSGKSLMIKTLINSIPKEDIVFIENINLSDKKALKKDNILLATQYKIPGNELKHHELDLFMFLIKIQDLTFQDELRVLDNKEKQVNRTVTKKSLKEIQTSMNKVFADEKIKEYIVRIIDSTRNPEKYKLTTSRFVSQGSSTRGSIFLYKAARAEALIQGRNYVIPSDVKTVAPDILRHRIQLNYEGNLENISADVIIEEILKKIPIP